jgi:predicted SnoaL-like aldol condensation-catalyzing enzyme
MERLETATRVVLAFNEIFNRHDVAGMMAQMTEDIVFENKSPAPDGNRYEGKAAVMQFWQEFFHRSPHVHTKIEEIFGMGFHCVVRWRYDWEDVDGETEHVRGADIFQVKDGLICEMLSYVKG